MFRVYRPLEKNEFIVVGGDCSQGGGDYNALCFMSKSKLDVPIVYHARGVAATIPPVLHPTLERIQEVTGVQPVVALEQNNGGISEMERLSAMNRLNKYKLYVMPYIGREGDTGKYGYSTNSATRPILLGDWKKAYDDKIFSLYDEQSLKEHRSFVVSRSGKPEAERGSNDDLVFAHAIAYQLYIQCNRPEVINYNDLPRYEPRDSIIGV